MAILRSSISVEKQVSDLRGTTLYLSSDLTYMDMETFVRKRRIFSILPTLQERYGLLPYSNELTPRYNTKRSKPVRYAKASLTRFGSVLRGTKRPFELHLWQLHCKTLPSAPGAPVRDLRSFRAALRAYKEKRSRPAVGCSARCACSTTASSPCWSVPHRPQGP